MIYVVEMDVNIPESWNEEKIADYLAREKACSQQHQKSGKWVYLWRVAGKYSNISVLDVSGPDELHSIVSSLPLFPYMNIKVTSICKHPNALRDAMI
ncbi:muconolactone Delta-isomerase family protein [Flavobacterium sp. HSC-61S13]|uniref:muconolactone Delta-isomerase family protein n=1 Tax=Flavobacterium sp. HSC-61S13 TaxID=2910963 RepID=UPI00209F0365|nr:muconolactone Delta-isomerase family protein [Flavobacterium sp. HSC-61S13]MCP1996131.1 muconolactone D-isomerase [Flavobacterium sp. HSC-61S13]